MMEKNAIEEIELDLLLQAIVNRYGYDFRDYSRVSLTRRVRHALKEFGHETITDLIKHLLYSPDFFQDLLGHFSVVVTEMFRNPRTYQTLRQEVIPHLKTYPFLKVWHAGCATGEEAYSLAILLFESDMLERTTIYATDFNESALEVARNGIYPMERIQEYHKNYLESGGRRSLSEYYHARYENVIMAKFLREKITFARHNLVTDFSFGEMHLILCRNVMIYFNRSLQNKVFELFAESLIQKGFLCLGSKESLRGATVAANFSVFNAKARIYRQMMV